MIPRFRPELDWHEVAAAFTMSGQDDVSRFEKEFARKFGQKHAIAFPYGRTGLMLLLEAMRLRDSEIICPAYTCVVVPHAIIFSGNTPVFIDCKEGDFNMDLDAARDAVTARTGAIIATSVFGYPVDLDKLEKIRAKYPGLKVIQDCAHSFAAEWQGKPVQKAGDAAIFGLNISKMITSVFGGMATTDNDALAEKLRSLRNERLKRAGILKTLRRLFYLLLVYPSFSAPVYGLVNRLERSGSLDGFVKYYNEAVIDMPKDYLEAFTAIEARVGCVQLQKYDRIIKKRREKAEDYIKQFKNQTGIKILSLINGATYSHIAALVEKRDDWLLRYQRMGIQLGTVIDYSIPYIRAYRMCKKGEYPVSKYYSEHTINFPV